MSSPQRAIGDSWVRFKRSRSLLLGTLAVVGAIGLGVLVAFATGTGFVGFALTLLGTLMLVIGTVNLREIRRSSRRLGRQSERSTARIRAMEKALAEQRRQINALLATQLDANRALHTGLNADAVEERLTSQLRQQQALMNLFTLYPMTAVVPASKEWTADVVAALVAELLRGRPSVVVECGSGAATVWLALAIRHHGLDSRVVCLEDDKEAQRELLEALRAHGVSDLVDIRHAPLGTSGLEGHGTDWYDPSALDGLADVGLLVVDGPDSDTGPQARYPAVPLLRDRLAPSATVFLIGTARPAEQVIAERWHILLPEFARDDLDVEAGAVRFRRSAAA